MLGIGASRIADECLDRLLAQQAPDERFAHVPSRCCRLDWIFSDLNSASAARPNSNNSAAIRGASDDARAKRAICHQCCARARALDKPLANAEAVRCQTTLGAAGKERRGHGEALLKMNKPTLALKPLPTSDRAESVMSALAGYIARSRLKPGDRLPAERELMGAGGRPLDRARGDPPAAGARHRRIAAGQRHLSAAQRLGRHHPYAALDQHARIARRPAADAGRSARARGRGERPGGAAPHAKDLKASSASWRRWSACITRRARPGARISPSISRSTTPPTIRCSRSCWSRCARPSRVLGQAVRPRRLRARGLFRSTASCSTPSRPATTRARRDKTLAILAIVEEDIKEMSQ